jgi:hypothetical protein
MTVFALDPAGSIFDQYMMFKTGKMPPSAGLLGIISRTFFAAQRTDGSAVFPRKDVKMNNAFKEQLGFTKLETFKGQGLSYYSFYLNKDLTDLMTKKQQL